MITTSPSGIGEPDRQRERVTAGLEQRAEHHHPAHEQQRAGDQQPVEHGPDPAREAASAHSGRRAARPRPTARTSGIRCRRSTGTEPRVRAPTRTTSTRPGRSPTTGTRGRAGATLAPSRPTSRRLRRERLRTGRRGQPPSARGSTPSGCTGRSSRAREAAPREAHGTVVAVMPRIRPTWNARATRYLSASRLAALERPSADQRPDAPDGTGRLKRSASCR